MANLKSIKSKILSYKKTGTVTHAMVAVSVLERLSGTADVSRHPLMRERNGKTAVVIVTSDKGLAGSLNSGVIRKIEQELKSRGLSKSDTVFAAIGRRGGDYFASRGYDVRIKQENVSDDIPEGGMRAVTQKIMEWHAAGEIGSCIVAYQNFISTFEQTPSIRQLIPILPEMLN